MSHPSLHDDQSGGEHEPDYQRRHRYSRPELDELNASYYRNPRPCRGERERLARFCNVGVSQIQIWFQNRRAKDRRCAENRLQQYEQSLGSPQTGTTPSPSSTCSSQPTRRQASVILSHEIPPPSDHDADGLDADE